jgi:hypothetical protein
METPPQNTIPARRGVAVPMLAGQKIRVVNTHGSQVLDTWAVARPGAAEWLSMEHTRSRNTRWDVRPGLVFVTNRRRPMLVLEQDTVPGHAHDGLICACNREVYRELGCEGVHDNCEDNFFAAMAVVEAPIRHLPAPLNLFMNFPIAPDGSFSRVPPASRPGDYVVLRAEMDLWMVFSACPQDMTVVNGAARRPTDAHYQVF